MFSAIAKSINAKWGRLTMQSRSRRLSWFAIILVFALDSYVLSLLFDGLEEVGETITTPVLRISPACKTASQKFLQMDAPHRAATIAEFAINARNITKDEFARQFDVDDLRYVVHTLLPLCLKVRDKLHATVTNEELINLLNKQELLGREIRETETKIKAIQEGYSDALLEKLARQKRSDSILPLEATEIKGKVAELNSELAELQQQYEETQSALEQNPMVGDYVQFLSALPIDGEFRKEELRHNNQTYWYPIKVLGAQVAFLIPPLLLAIFWNRRAIRKQQEHKILISAHLILVCALPICVRGLYFLGEMLPRQLLGRLMELLASWQIGFVWYYALILLVVALGLLLVFIAQRTLFTAARQRMIRLRKALCHACGEKLHSSEQACCEICGAGQSIPCTSCGQQRRMIAFHCGHCGRQAAPE